MQLGKLRINWGSKAKYNIVDEKSILKEFLNIYRGGDKV